MDHPHPLRNSDTILTTFHTETITYFLIQMAYNIIELNEKLTTELRVLAKEMGIRRPDAYKKEELIYKILDEQAIAETKKLGPEPGSRQGNKGRNASDNNTKNQKNRDNKSESKSASVKKVESKDRKSVV